MDYWRAIEPYWNRVDIYHGPRNFLESLATVPEPLRHLLGAHWLDSEVCNGGLFQFFDNDTGVLAPEALAGLEAVGDSVGAQIVGDALAFFGAPYPRERPPRRRVLQAHIDRFPSDTPRREWDPFHALDSAYFAAGIGRFSEYADRYAATLI